MYIYQNCIPNFPFDLPMRSNTYTFAVHALNIGTLMFISIISSVHNMCNTFNHLNRIHSSFFDQEFLDYKCFAHCCSLINGSCKHVIESYTLMWTHMHAMISRVGTIITLVEHIPQQKSFAGQFF